MLTALQAIAYPTYLIMRTKRWPTRLLQIPRPHRKMTKRTQAQRTTTSRTTAKVTLPHHKPRPDLRDLPLLVAEAGIVFCQAASADQDAHPRTDQQPQKTILENLHRMHRPNVEVVSEVAIVDDGPTANLAVRASSRLH